MLVKVIGYQDYSAAISLVLIIGYYVFRLVIYSAYIMIGTPAIIITTEYIFLNKKGCSIAWRDIESIDSTGSSQAIIKSASLQITLRDTWRNRGQQRNLLVKAYYWMLAHMISIPFVLIKGDTQKCISP